MTEKHRCCIDRKQNIKILENKEEENNQATYKKFLEHIKIEKSHIYTRSS